MNKPDPQAQVQPLPVQYYIPDTNSDDEVDLLELAISIIKQWKLMLLICVSGALISFVYAKLKPELYQNFALVRAPIAANIAVFNTSYKQQLEFQAVSIQIQNQTQNQVIAKSSFPLYTPENLFKRYYEQIRSTEAFKEFLLHTNVLDQFHEKFKSDAEKQQFLRDVVNMLEVEILTSDDTKSQLLRIQMTTNNEDIAIQTINEFIVYTEQKIIQQILIEQGHAVTLRRKLINTEIDLLRDSATQQRLNKIIQLEEALTKAKKMNIVLPTSLAMLGSSKTALQTQVSVFTEKQAQQLFLMGSKYLQIEIDLLQQRGKINTADDPYITGLQAKLDELAMLDKIALDFNGAQLYILDKIAAKNDAPVKPNKRLIFALGSLLSVFLALIMALIVASIMKRKENNC